MNRESERMMKITVLDPRSLLQATLSAIIHASVWLIVLGVFTDHPVEEWVVAIGAIYTIWLISINSIIFLFGMLGRYFTSRFSTIIERLEIDPEDEDYRELSNKAWLYLVPVAALSMTALGISLATASSALTAMEFVGLPAWFQLVGIGMVVLGMCVLVPLIGLSLAVIALAEGFISLKEETELQQEPAAVDAQTRRNRLVRVFPVVSLDFGDWVARYREGLPINALPHERA